ncbi:MAG: hypothetical protein V3V15_02745 [Sphingorhabdus sp.]
MKRLCVIQISNNKRGFSKHAAHVFLELCKHNNVETLSVIYCEVFVDDYTQIITKTTENYENVEVESIAKLVDKDIFFIAGNRKNLSFIFEQDDEEILLIHEDGSISIPENIDAKIGYSDKLIEKGNAMHHFLELSFEE